jgi:hypothetical protein
VTRDAQDGAAPGLDGLLALAALALQNAARLAVVEAEGPGGDVPLHGPL